MSEAFKKYRRTQIAEMRPIAHDDREDTTISISAVDRQAGSPKPGDMIARNPANHSDQWLVAAAYFAANFEPIPDPAGYNINCGGRDCGQCAECKRGVCP